MSRQTTDVDRALAAIGGPALPYRSFGPRPIAKHNPELDNIFSYNEAGVSEYHPPVSLTQEDYSEAVAMAPLAGLPVGEYSPRLSDATSASQAVVRQAPANPQVQSDVWQDQGSRSGPILAASPEERSLAAMFNMLAGKTHGQVPQTRPSAAPDAPRQDDKDLFRRL